MADMAAIWTEGVCGGGAAIQTDPARQTWCPDVAKYDRGECGWPKCGCPETDEGIAIGSVKRPASAETQQTLIDEIKRLRAGLNDVRKFLKKPEWGTISYMEGSEVYDDKDLALADIAYALGEINSIRAPIAKAEEHPTIIPGYDQEFEDHFKLYGTYPATYKPRQP